MWLLSVDWRLQFISSCKVLVLGLCLLRGTAQPQRLGHGPDPVVVRGEAFPALGKMESENSANIDKILIPLHFASN